MSAAVYIASVFGQILRQLLADGNLERTVKVHRIYGVQLHIHNKFVLWAG